MNGRCGRVDVLHHLAHNEWQEMSRLFRIKRLENAVSSAIDCGNMTVLAWWIRSYCLEVNGYPNI